VSRGLTWTYVLLTPSNVGGIHQASASNLRLKSAKWSVSSNFRELDQTAFFPLKTTPTVRSSINRSNVKLQ
jgi:hypothetical protein